METLLEIIKQHCILCDGDDELDDYIKEIILSEKITLKKDKLIELAKEYRKLHNSGFWWVE